MGEVVEAVDTVAEFRARFETRIDHGDTDPDAAKRRGGETERASERRRFRGRLFRRYHRVGGDRFHERQLREAFDGGHRQVSRERPDRRVNATYLITTRLQCARQPGHPVGRRADNDATGIRLMRPDARGQRCVQFGNQTLRRLRTGCYREKKDCSKREIRRTRPGSVGGHGPVERQPLSHYRSGPMISGDARLTFS